MTKFLNEERLLKALDDMFYESKKFMYLVSPYIKLDDWLKNNFEDCQADSLIIVYGKKFMEFNSYDFLREFADIELYFHKDLHAKVYINERRALISSMNLYDYSMDNNIECGVQITADDPAYKYALDFVQGVIEDSKPIQKR